MITTRHDEYRPFYTCAHKYGRIILTLNSAHPFFQRVWQPLNDLAKTVDISQEGNEDADEVTSGVAATANEVLVAIQLMLLSLARTQSQLSGHDSQSEYRQLFKKLQCVWSENYQTQLLAH